MKKVNARLAELRYLTESKGLTVLQFNAKCIHLRVVGKCQVDYWPRTGTAWVVGRPGKKLGKGCSPAQVCDAAQQL